MTFQSVFRKLYPVLPGLLLLSALRAQQVPGGESPDRSTRLEFSLDRPGAAAERYLMVVFPSGEGTFTSLLTTGGPAPPQPIALDGDLVRTVFAAVPMVEGGRCETHSKGIAQTGTKTLRYVSPARNAQCTYNYSDDERVNDATTAFEGLAETLAFGDRLRRLLRFDRLGLDSELDHLQAAVKEQHALGIGNIAAVLQAIVANDRVMERVRRRAQQLLASVPPTAVPPTPEAAPQSSAGQPQEAPSESAPSASPR